MPGFRGSVRGVRRSEGRSPPLTGAVQVADARRTGTLRQAEHACTACDRPMLRLPRLDSSRHRNSAWIANCLAEPNASGRESARNCHARLAAPRAPQRCCSRSTRRARRHLRGKSIALMGGNLSVPLYSARRARELASLSPASAYRAWPSSIASSANGVHHTRARGIEPREPPNSQKPPNLRTPELPAAPRVLRNPIQYLLLPAHHPELLARDPLLQHRVRLAAASCTARSESTTCCSESIAACSARLALLLPQRGRACRTRRPATANQSAAEHAGGDEESLHSAGRRRIFLRAATCEPYSP